MTTDPSIYLLISPRSYYAARHAINFCLSHQGAALEKAEPELYEALLHLYRLYKRTPYIIEENNRKPPVIKLSEPIVSGQPFELTVPYSGKL